MICNNCGKDYKEVFENGSYCFGCGNRENFGSGLLDSKLKAKELEVFYAHLSAQDVKDIGLKWNIVPIQLGVYGVHLAISKFTPSVNWIVFPVLDENGREIMSQLRAWKGTHKTKYLSSRTEDVDPTGVVWKSWHQKSWNTPGLQHPVVAPMRYPLIGIVEGIPDGLRLSQFLPTIALIGSTPDQAKIDTVLKSGERFVVMLDADALDHAFDIQRRLGVQRTLVIPLVSGDPADLTPAQLGGILRSWDIV